MKDKLHDRVIANSSTNILDIHSSVPRDIIYENDQQDGTV